MLLLFLFFIIIISGWKSGGIRWVLPKNLTICTTHCVRQWPEKKSGIWPSRFVQQNWSNYVLRINFIYHLYAEITGYHKSPVERAHLWATELTINKILIYRAENSECYFYHLCLSRCGCRFSWMIPTNKISKQYFPFFHFLYKTKWINSKVYVIRIQVP